MHHRDKTIRLLARLALTATLVAGCGPSATSGPPAVDPRSARPEGMLALPATVWDQSPRARLLDGEAHGYLLPGKANARIRARMRAVDCGLPTPVLHLFGAPDPSGDRGPALATAGAEGACSAGAILEATLPDDGDAPGTEYLLVASAEGGASLPVRYRLDVTCDAGPCDVSRTFAQSQMSKAELTAEGGPDVPEARRAALLGKLDSAGAFLFQHVFQLSDGLGNGMHGGAAGPLERPNMRLVHDGPFGGPDSQSCVSCHSRDGVYGGGELDQNLYQAGDGEDPASALVRNPPSLFGAGEKQAIAAEITAQLQDRRDALVAKAKQSGESAEDDLCIEGPNGRQQPCFGKLIADPDGTVHTDGVLGIDADLAVRPFGWKGREKGLYRFVQGGFRVHFGVQAEGPIDDFCGTFSCEGFDDACQQAMARFGATWGTPWPPQPCEDPDDDGISREITAGQIAATAVHLALLPPPPASAPCGAAERGKAAFLGAGCATCHVESMPFAAMSLLDPDTGLRVPLPARLSDVAMWSDLRRHDMPDLVDNHPFDNFPADPIAPSAFLTPPLWDVARTAPYLHDGRAATLEEAITGHGVADGKLDVAAAYRALPAGQRADLLAFLGSLGAPQGSGDCAP